MKTNTAFLLILGFALLLRLPGIDSPLFGDAIQWARFYCTGQYWFTDTGHPSLSGWLTNASCLAFGVMPWVIRLPFLLVSLAVIFVTYLFGRRFFNEKTALLSSFFLAVSPWLVGIGTAPMQDNYLMLFFLIGFFAYLSWLKKPHWKYLAVIAVVFGLSCITKTSAVFLPAITGVHQLWRVLKKHQEFKAVLKLWPALLGLIVPVIYYLIQFTFGSTVYTGYTVQRTAIKLFTAGGYSFPFASWFLTFVLGVPAFFALLVLSLRYCNKNRACEFLWFWIAIPAVVYSFFVIHNNIERFIQIALPAMALLASDFVIRSVPDFVGFLRERWTIILSFFSITVLAIAYLAFEPSQYAAPYHSFGAYLPALASPHRFFFPVLSDMGPTYYLPVTFVIASAVVGFAWLATALYGIFAKKQAFLRTAVVCLLVSFFATSIFVLAEQHFSVKGPSVSGLASLMSDALIDYAGNYKKILVIGAHHVGYPWRNMQDAPLEELYLAINATEGGIYKDKESGVSIHKEGIILLRSNAEFEALAQTISQYDLVLFEDFPPLPGDNVLKKRLALCNSVVRAEHRGLVFSLLDCS